MKTVNYKNYRVETYNEQPVAIDNYFKYDIVIRDNEGKYVARIHNHELTIKQVEGLLSGDEKLAQEALNSIIRYREGNLLCLKNIKF